MLRTIDSINRKLFSYKIVRYGLIGGISTLIHFSIAFIYIYFINNSVLQSNTIGFFIAYIFSYLTQSKYVFLHKIHIAKAIKYFVVQFGVLLLSILVSNIFNEYNSYIKTIIVVIILPLITFVIHKFWTFKINKG